MEPKLILYQDLKKDYHRLLFSSDLRCMIAGQYNNLPPSVTQGSKRHACMHDTWMWTHVSSLREAGCISSALVPVQRRVTTYSLLLTAETCITLCQSESPVSGQCIYNISRVSYEYFHTYVCISVSLGLLQLFTGVRMSPN